MKNSKVDNFFGAVGFGFPENEEELKAFDLAFEDYKIEGNVHKINPEKILSDIKIENTKVTKIDYHKRTVLAAEIVCQLKDEYTLGHLKLQKLMYLCQHTTSMQLHTNFLRQAMGPYDPHLMRSLDKQFKAHQWFEYIPNECPKYRSLDKAGEHRIWFERYFQEQTSDIDFLIEKFRKFKTDKVEIIATVFACWKDSFENKELINDELIIKKFYQWHENKLQYEKDRIVNAIKWMREEGVFPG